MAAEINIPKLMLNIFQKYERKLIDFSTLMNYLGHSSLLRERNESYLSTFSNV